MAPMPDEASVINAKPSLSRLTSPSPDLAFVVG
jgi:hypothetical protein